MKTMYAIDTSGGKAPVLEPVVVAKETGKMFKVAQRYGSLEFSINVRRPTTLLHDTPRAAWDAWLERRHQVLVAAERRLEVARSAYHAAVEIHLHAIESLACDC